MNIKFSRREFLNLVSKLLAALGLAGVLGPAIAYFYPSKLEETPSDPVFVATDSEIPLGESKTVKLGRYPALIIHTQDGLKAYSAVCTHFACIVMWNPEINQIACPCHAGFFDPLDGSVISGPPPIGLEKLHIDNLNGEIYVSAGGDEE